MLNDQRYYLSYFLSRTSFSAQSFYDKKKVEKHTLDHSFGSGSDTESVKTNRSDLSDIARFVRSLVCMCVQCKIHNRSIVNKFGVFHQIYIIVRGKSSNFTAHCSDQRKFAPVYLSYIS